MHRGGVEDMSLSKYVLIMRGALHDAIYIILIALSLMGAVGVPVFSMFGLAWVCGKFGMWWALLFFPWVIFLVLWCIFCEFVGHKIKM